MGIDLRLPSGLVIRNAACALAAKFKEWPWENYDGTPVQVLNRIQSGDISRVYQLGVRTPRAAYERLLEQHGEVLSECLSAIPDEAIEDDGLQLAGWRGSVVRLFDLVMGMKSIKLAGATKLVAPFRPALLPVIDSVVENYYWYATSIKDEASFRNLEHAYRKGPGTYVLALMDLIRDDVRGTLGDLDVLLKGCGSAPYANASRVRVLESLIWFYYARGGSWRNERGTE